MDIFQELQQEHAQVKKIIKQMRSEEDRSALSAPFVKLQHELHTHMEGEEKFLYPALVANAELKEQVLEAYEEHHAAQLVLGELGDLPKDHERWMAKLTVLQEQLDHHIEEEEQELFPEARKVLDKQQVGLIQARYHELRRNAMAAAT
jgi:iron-sulfur cluster repair protein YtfE (RIC family)